MEKLLVSVLALLFLAACNIMPAEQIKTDSLDYKIDPADTKNIKDPVTMNIDLPVEKLVIISGKNSHELEVEVASTDAQRRVGLMNRNSLDENRGVLFLFQEQGYLNFWMKNTLVALDLIFIDQNGYIRHITKNAQPCLDQPDKACPLYGSEEPVKYVLEVNGGWTDRREVREGDKVSWL